VRQPVSISAQPASRTVQLGDSATFSVSASGTRPLSYQWRKNGTPIEGATAPDLTIGSVGTADVGSYDVMVAGACGAQTSVVAELSLSAPVAFRLEAIGRLPGGAFQLNLIGAAGQIYAIQSSTNLVDWSTWTNIVSNAASAPVVDGRNTGTYQFYRAIAQ
jgi:hypothetical protein